MKTKSRGKLLACLTFAAAFAALAGSSGCLSPGTVVFYRGQLEMTVAADFDRTVEASKSALRQLNRTTYGSSRTEVIATFMIRDAGETNIDLRLERQVAGQTRVLIRAGEGGRSELELSLAVLDKIKANL